MSELFSHRVKAEAAKGITGRKKCDAALLGMLLFAHKLSQDEIVFRTENPDVAELICRLLGHVEGAGEANISKKERDPRPAIYTVGIRGEHKVSAVLDRVGLSGFSGERSFSLAGDIPEKLFGSFVAGIFLICGSVADPNKGYHLEFVAPTERLCRELGTELSERMGLDGGIIRRRSSHVLYFKESEHIEDILTLIGSPHSSIELMNVKIYKDLRNRANRATNCDTANLGKQSRSARKQIEAIEKIEKSGKMKNLPDELKEVAVLRKENPDLSLSELCLRASPPMSRSGMNHRLQRIIKTAEEL